MPGERLTCVWDAADILSSGNAKTLTVSVLKDITSKFADLPSVDYSERKFDRVLACFDDIKFLNYKSYVHSVLTKSDVPILVCVDQIEKRCWELCRNRYLSVNTSEDVVEMLWRLFNRFADEKRFPLVIYEKEITFLFVCLTEKLNRDMTKAINLLGKSATFGAFLKILDEFAFIRAEKDLIRSVVFDVHEQYAKNFMKWGWMHVRNQLMLKLTWWEKCWFVLTQNKLAYFGKSFLSDPDGCSFKGEISISSSTKVEPLPPDDVVYKSYSGRFQLLTDQDEVELSSDSDIERRFWLELVRDIIQSNLTEKQDPISPDKIQIEIQPVTVEKCEKVSATSTETEKTQNIIEMEEEKLKVIFMKLDKDGNGILDKNEFFQFFELVGMSMSTEDANLVFKKIDIDKSGKISFDEFVKYFESVIFHDGEGDNVASRLRSAFLSADRDGSGTINVKEYIEYMWEQRRGVAMSKLLKTFESLPQSGDGEISYEQFKQYCENENNLGILPDTGPSSEDGNMNKMLKKLYDDTDSDELAEFLKERWNSFSSFKRKGASGEVVMSSPDGMVADFTPGNYSLMDLACFSDVPPIEPKHTVIKGVKWISGPEPGKSGRCVFPIEFDGKILCDFATNETLRYYNCSFANGKQEKISLLYRHGIQDFLYANKYLDDYVKLQNGGSGIEKHEFSHLDCPMEEDSGYFILGKMHTENEIHLTAFRIPVLHALYVPGLVIHSNDYLKGKWRTMLSDEANIDHVHLVQQKEKETFQNITFTFSA